MPTLIGGMSIHTFLSLSIVDDLSLLHIADGLLCCIMVVVVGVVLFRKSRRGALVEEPLNDLAQFASARDHHSYAKKKNNSCQFAVHSV
jgi:hypothetical protein